MNLIDEIGKEHSVNLAKYFGKKKVNCSALHKKVREFLLKEFLSAQILEEVFIPGWNLYLDFYLPLFKIACEADGEQHLEYTPFFHGIHKNNFAKAKGRDLKKERFCDANSITLIRFYEEETISQWKKKLQLRV